jgi:UDP-N-acetylglucosamine 2-epimerase
VTTEKDNRAHLETTLKVVASFDLPTIWFWPNPDAGTGEMADMLRNARERHPKLTANMRFITNVPANDFVALLAHAACLVGNSSAGIKECSFLGTPVVNIGNRQQGRLTGAHVLQAGYEAEEIGAAIATQLAHGRYQPSHIYYRENASDAIAAVLAKTPLYTQKRFHD